MKYAFVEKRPPLVELTPGDVVFIGEGGDECALLEALTSHWKQKPVLLTKSDDPGVSPDEQFRAIVQQATKARIAALGLLFDAEDKRDRTVRKLRQMFKKAALVFPQKANTVRVTRMNGVSLKAAYHINPAGRGYGAIEALFKDQASEGDTGVCIKALLKCYEKYRSSPVVKRDKILVRTFLAQQNPGNTGLRTALQRGFLRCDGPEFDNIRDFVRKLQPLETPLLTCLDR